MKFIIYISVIIGLFSCSKNTPNDPPPTPPTPPINPSVSDSIPVITSRNAKQMLVFESITDDTYFINSYDSNLVLKWSMNGTGKPDMIHSSNNDLFAISTLITPVNYDVSAHLTKINASTGQIIWQKVFPDKIPGGIIQTGDSLLINFYNGYLLTGEIGIISAQTGNVISTINTQNGFYPLYLTLNNGMLYFYTNRGGLQTFQNAYDLTANSFKWTKPATTSILNGEGRIYDYSNTLVTASASGNIAGINKVTGEAIWINNYTKASYGNDRYYYPPTNSELFFANVNEPSKIVALVPETGTQRWEWNNAGNDFIWKKNQQDNNLFFLIVQNIQPYVQFIALNALTGKEYYRRPQNFLYHTQFVTAGRYSYTFKNELNITNLPNVPTKFLKFDNLSGRVVDSANIPNGKVMLISN